MGCQLHGGLEAARTRPSRMFAGCRREGARSLALQGSLARWREPCPSTQSSAAAVGSGRTGPCPRDPLDSDSDSEEDLEGGVGLQRPALLLVGRSVALERAGGAIS